MALTSAWYGTDMLPPLTHDTYEVDLQSWGDQSHPASKLSVKAKCDL